MAWLYLVLGGLFEICWAVGLKHCYNWKVTIFVIVSVIINLILLWLAAKTIPVSIVYSVCTGVGVVGILLYDVFIVKEPVTATNVFFICLILVGVIGIQQQSSV